MTSKSINSETFLAGDIGLSYTNSFVSKIILFFTSWQTKKATCSHSFVCINDNRIVEAVDKIRENSISKYDKKTYTKISVYRIPLSDEDRQSLHEGLKKRIGGAYGWFKLPLFALDAVATKITSFFGRKAPIFFFTKTFGISNIPVCSQLIVWALHKFTSYRLLDRNKTIVNWKIISPDYLEDLLQLSHNSATLFYAKLRHNNSN